MRCSTGRPECTVLSPSRNSRDTTAADRPPPDKILKNRAIDPVATASLDRKTPKSATSLTRRPTKLGLFRKMPSSSPANQTTATPMSVALTTPPRQTNSRKIAKSIPFPPSDRQLSNDEPPPDRATSATRRPARLGLFRKMPSSSQSEPNRRPDDSSPRPTHPSPPDKFLKNREIDPVPPAGSSPTERTRPAANLSPVDRPNWVCFAKCPHHLHPNHRHPDVRRGLTHPSPPDKFPKNREIDPVPTIRPAPLDTKEPGKPARSVTRRPAELGLFRKMPSSSPANQITATPMSAALTHPSSPDKILKNREIDPVPAASLDTKTPKPATSATPRPAKLASSENNMACQPSETRQVSPISELIGVHLRSSAAVSPIFISGGDCAPAVKAFVSQIHRPSPRKKPKNGEIDPVPPNPAATCLPTNWLLPKITWRANRQKPAKCLQYQNLSAFICVHRRLPPQFSFPGVTAPGSQGFRFAKCPHHPQPTIGNPRRPPDSIPNQPARRPKPSKYPHLQNLSTLICVHLRPLRSLSRRRARTAPARRSSAVQARTAAPARQQESPNSMGRRVKTVSQEKDALFHNANR